MPEAGSPKDRIEALRACQQQADELIKAELARALDPKALRNGSEEHREQAEALLRFAEPKHLTHPMVRRLERNGLSLHSGLSFRATMLEQSEARRLGIFRPAWKLDNKRAAYEFIDALGVRRPKSDGKIRRIDTLEPDSPLVIKPVRATGSRGVYISYSSDRVTHLRDQRELGSWEKMLAHAGRLMSQERANPVPDRWLVEELILEDAAEHRPATDLKFYAFYGEVILVRESRRVDSGQHVTFWRPDGTIASTGHDRDPVLEQAQGPTPEQLEQVSRISAEIPVPFMRIDMLRGEHELVFGEFTPRPGHFDEFNDEWDRRFGEAWASAEARIMSDVLAGKNFGAFAEAIGHGK